MRWKRTVSLGAATMLLALLAMVTPTPGAAVVGSNGPEPAATLLLPYFIVDFQDPNGPTTVLSIHNASAAPALTHITLWTDWGYPTLAFDMYLTGYDAETIDLREIFAFGNIPITADLQSDPLDEISPKGPLSTDDSFTLCDQFFPNFVNPVLPSFNLVRIRTGHTGQFVPTVGACVGQDLGDGIARGYVTIDNVTECSLVLDPGDFGGTGTPYFIDGGTGVASNRNQLWGDWFIVDPVNNFAQGDSLVHIKADDGFNALNIPLKDFDDPPNTVANVANVTGYTFYGRYLVPADGRDNREPLGTIWGTRYFNNPGLEGTTLSVWRDSTAYELSPFGWGCGFGAGAGPSWYPLNETEVVAFDLQEDAVELCFFTGGVVAPPDEKDPACFPALTGQYPVGVGDLEVPFDAGWLYLNLNIPPDAPIGDHDFGTHGNIGQSWVTAVHDSFGLYSVALPAIELSGALQDNNASIIP